MSEMKKKIPLPLQSKESLKGRKISSFHLQLKENQDNLNDLIQYQKTSSKKSCQSCTGKWLARILFKIFPSQIKLLDIGALDGSTWDKFRHKIQVESIDLNPISSKVKRQDFFKRPFGEYFHVVSLSLVLNFVQNPFKRGEMLMRAVLFLKEKGILYLTLPKSCVENSRYLTGKSLEEIAKGLGLGVLETHFSRKLVFYAFEIKGKKIKAQKEIISVFYSTRMKYYDLARRWERKSMSRNFLNRRSTPVSDSTGSRLIQDLVVPEVLFVDFKLDSWGREFESSVNQKLYQEYESSAKKYENFQKKIQLNSISLQIIKDQITELEESKSSNLDFSNDKLGLHILQADKLKKDKAENGLGSIVKFSRADHLRIPVEENNEGILEQEVVSEESTCSESSDNYAQYVPPRQPINVDALISQKEKVMDELNQEKDILSDLIGEEEILKVDLVYYENNSSNLIQACKSMFKDSYDLLNKLKTAGYANDFEVDGFKKLTAFFKMIVANQLPQPDVLGKAIDKIFGDESKYYQMPELSSVLSKLQKTTTSSSKFNHLGSSSNLKGSSSNLKGSSSNLKGSSSNLRNLRGSSAGLGEWSSDFDINRQSLNNLLKLHNDS